MISRKGPVVNRRQVKRKWDPSVFAKFHFFFFFSTVSNNISLEYYFVLSTTIIFEKSIVIVNNLSLLLEWLYCQFVWVSIGDANIHSAETAVEYSATGSLRNHDGDAEDNVD